MSVWSSSELCPNGCGWTVGQCGNTCGGVPRMESYKSYADRIRASEEAEKAVRTARMLEAQRLAREAAKATSEEEE